MADHQRAEVTDSATGARGAKEDRLFAIKGRVLRAKHRDGEERVIIDIDDLLALFSQRDRAIRRARKFKWLYQRQRGHMRRLVEHFTADANHKGTNDDG